MENAFWVSPRGEVIAVPMRHIANILQDPKKFGLTQADIDAVYRRFNEPTGWEGKAREELMLDAMKRGWIRVRRSMNQWVIQAWRLSRSQKDAIWDFITYALKRGIVGKNSQITLHDIKGDSVVTSSAKELAKALFEQRTRKVKLADLLK